MLSDAVLVERVLAGFDDAFDELYRRHADAAWRLGQAVTGNIHDASDAVSEAFARVLQAVRAGKLADGAAFRAYLMSATRNAALDGLRKHHRVHPAEGLEALPTLSPTPAESASHAVDAGLVAEAFRNLPERWRSVLWLTEVEGVATKDAADQLGLSPNGTAQLAVRARAGLRDRYLQAHVKGDAKPACRFTVDRLGAYVGGSISPRDLAKVDQHLAGCADCRARKDELSELGTTLRHIALPIPLALGALSAERVHAVLTASTSLPTGSLATRALQAVKEPTPFTRRLAGASAAGVLALGLLALPFASNGDDHVKGLNEPGTQAQSGAPAAAELPAASFDGSATAPYATTSGYSTGTTSSDRRSFSAPRGVTPAQAPSTPPATPPAAPPPAATSPDAPANPLSPLTDLLSPFIPAPVPTPDSSGTTAGAGVNLGPVDAGITAVIGTSPAAGVEVGDTVIGTADPTTPTSPGVTLQVGTITQTVPLP